MLATSSRCRELVIWWRILCVLSVFNICLWAFIWRFGPSDNPYSVIQLLLSGIYVFVCAYRSLLPRVDLERLVLFDSPLSSIFLGRSAATVAEICFGIQLGLLVHQLGAQAELPWVQNAAWVITLCTILAQVFCWHSILTLNHITQAVEELLWAAGLSWMAGLLAIIAMDTTGGVHLLAIAGIVGSVVFVAYVLLFDIPMYWRRFRGGRNTGLQYLTISQGVGDAIKRREPALAWNKWRDDALWLTPYFSLGVWVSMALVLVPLVL
tara:strand:- start:17363 stop:18160 length:798 start_codon:yes stop_codon:yes gene_type:complete